MLRPVGIACASCSVELHAGRVPAIRAISSAESGTLWRWAMTVSTLPSTCSSSSARGGAQVGQLLRREQQAEARGARATEQPRDALGGDRRELVDRDERRHRRGLAGCGDRQQVADDRRREHPREQRQPVGLEAEVARRRRARTASSRSSAGTPAARLEPAAELGLGEDREPVAGAARGPLRWRASSESR